MLLSSGMSAGPPPAALTSGAALGQEQLAANGAATGRNVGGAASTGRWRG